MTKTTNGLEAIAVAQLEIEQIFSLVPVEQRGLLFERVIKNFHPQATTSMLELGFALEWSAMNNRPGRDPLLVSLLTPDSDDPRKEATPKNAREWKVAELVAATLMQWLPTSVGTSFLLCAFRRGGGSFSYTLPKLK